MKKQHFDKITIASELVEVTDNANRPLLVMDLEDVHSQNLYHRTVFIAVYDMQKRLFLQKRSKNKKQFPGCWDLSAAGHVQAFESNEDAAIRELYEELGVSVGQLQMLGQVEASPETSFEYSVLFTTGMIVCTPQPNPLEVEDGFFADKAEVSCLVSQFPELLTPALLRFWHDGLLFPVESTDSDDPDQQLL